MPVVPGLSSNLRIPQPPMQQSLGDDKDIIVEIADEDGDVPELDSKGAVVKIQHGDGSVTVSLDGRPITEAENDNDNTAWFGNLVEKIDEQELSRIANDLLDGIKDDIESRKDWIEERAQGIRLLGLKIEIPNLEGATDGAPVEGMSKVRHPLLLEAVLRFQANARSELLPTDGPVKIRNDDNNAYLEEDDLADALEKDLNHYLTVTATEYYPDTDRMLLMLGFGGTTFKKVYFCPLRNRPVSETVDADNLIVSQSATDLSNAKRVTHRIMMRPSVVKRMQILGVYSDVDLNQALAPIRDAVQEEKNAQQGVSETTMRPEDRDREIYECYCELDVKGFEHKLRGKETGLEIPYRATIDVSSKRILSIVRNYDEDTKELPEARKRFTKYTFVPGMGFYDIGLLHILGNTTNAVTAAWREMLDAGMFSSFPGFLLSDAGGRQNTTIFRVPPGGAALIKTGGQKIGDAIAPLPYQPPSQALMALIDNMVQTGMRIGGTSEQQVGEGRADAPVGTTLAMIEQATKVLNSVHKRMHAAQAEEFQLLAGCFRENPESFWQRNKRPAYKWDEKTFLTALENHDLVPQADPNTASHSQRVMKIMALKQLQAASPSMYDPIAIDKAALKAIGWSNPEQFMAPAGAQGKPPPELLEAQSKVRANDATAQAKVLDSQTKAKEVALKEQELQQKGAAGKGPAPMELQLKAQDQKLKEQQMNFQQQRAGVDDENRDKDRDADLTIEQMRLAKEVMQQQADQEHERDMHGRGVVADHIRDAMAGGQGQ